MVSDNTPTEGAFDLRGERFFFKADGPTGSTEVYHHYLGRFRLIANVHEDRRFDDGGARFAYIHAPEIVYARGDARDLVKADTHHDFALGAALAYLERALAPRRARGGYFACAGQGQGPDYQRRAGLEAFLAHPAIELALIEAGLHHDFDPTDPARVADLDFNVAAAVMAWGNTARNDRLAQDALAAVPGLFGFQTKTGRLPAPGDLDEPAAALCQTLFRLADTAAFRDGLDAALTHAARAEQALRADAAAPATGR